MQILTKDPDAVLDFPVDWSDWLSADETISTSTWIVEAGLTAGNGANGPNENTPEPSHNDTVTTIWLFGGEAGQHYKVTNRISTNEGRWDDRSRIIKVLQR